MSIYRIIICVKSFMTLWKSAQFCKFWGLCRYTISNLLLKAASRKVDASSEIVTNVPSSGSSSSLSEACSSSSALSFLLGGGVIAADYTTVLWADDICGSSILFCVGPRFLSIVSLSCTDLTFCVNSKIAFAKSSLFAINVKVTAVTTK